uniref:Glycerophosphocholine acyltransferase 1 n=1 Tax=Chromera velia CCMP2878 TaxID=1169474 RepID=A0A0G4HTI1_9ALVE|mmetsp:Transcript_36869/g.72496  ORF Transcript_36869/g.72496 Transcript_36869/m.72496 type:complete len:537 (+) Transcript_36869:216-1826(+)|eukprot:Cvel_1344.t1-p1 / transcript=Cvel_1344.t1 / gene=Cvel_1344 / organism=Chromera_velia_CCMP2878 / gene_product=Uncharacterized membrane protein C776.05, putative / transcript_product=Uncharacterized membrane protein C776.05, putative / location=Cvel_scaffold46:50041-51648(+) / protein_length=536 / sequence_SO=supercontig / SO=protein_coding / is_pseudo=false
MEKSLKATLAPVKRRDEFVYSVGVMNVVLTFFLLGKYPEYFWVLHVLKTCTLIPFRLYSYKRARFHYFLFDFCYLVNVGLSIYCVLFYFGFIKNTPRAVFRFFFSVASGPLLVSIGTFRNSLVFHSVDKITSVFIHASPSLLCWAVRWNFEQVEARFPGMFVLCKNGSDACDASFWTLVVIPFVVYLFVWNIPYYYCIFRWRKERIAARDYVTLYSWMMQAGGLLPKVLKHLPEAWRPVAYMGVHAVFATLWMSLSMLFWRNFWIHTAWLTANLFMSVWFGATFYFEVFAERYHREVREILAKKKMRYLLRKEGETDGQRQKKYFRFRRSHSHQKEDGIALVSGPGKTSAPLCTSTGKPSEEANEGGQKSVRMQEGEEGDMHPRGQKILQRISTRKFIERASMSAFSALPEFGGGGGNSPSSSSQDDSNAPSHFQDYDEYEGEEDEEGDTDTMIFSDAEEMFGDSQSGEPLQVSTEKGSETEREGGQSRNGGAPLSPSDVASQAEGESWAIVDEKDKERDAGSTEKQPEGNAKKDR